MRLFYFSGYRADRAFLAAQRASAAFVRVYVIAYKLRTFSGGTAVFFYVSLVFVAEISERGEHGIRSRLTESAERAVLYLSAQLFEQLDISVSAIALAYPLKSFSQAHSADAAGDALPARLVCCEIKKEFCHAHHAGALVHNDHSARAHYRARCRKSLVVYNRVGKLRGDASAGRAAELNALELFAAAYSAADIKNNISERLAHRYFNKSAALYLACQRKNFCAFAGLGAYSGKRLSAVVDYPCYIRECLNIVYVRRLVHISRLRRERRLEARHTALTLKGFNKSCLFAADECSRARLYSEFA